MTRNPEAQALAKILNDKLPIGPTMSQEQSDFWNEVAWTLGNERIDDFARMAKCFQHPLYRVFVDAQREMEARHDA